MTDQTECAAKAAFLFGRVFENKMIDASFGIPAPPVPDRTSTVQRTMTTPAIERLSGVIRSQPDPKAFVRETGREFGVNSVQEFIPESAINRAFKRLRKEIYGEFDPGSGLTLAACLTHASRTR